MKYHYKNQEFLAEHVWSVQIPTIKYYKLQEKLQWSLLIDSTTVIVKHNLAFREVVI